MKCRTILIWLAAAASAALAEVTLAEQGHASGEELAWKYHCMTCHGEQGRSNSSRYPNLAGLPAPYIESRLKYFRSATEHGNQMNGQAAPLSDVDIMILAEHYSAMPVVAAPGGGAEDLVAAKGCVACHGTDGVATAPIYPNLRGQWARYLQLQLRAYRSGRRQNTIMQGFAAGLTNEEIRVLARHYGEQ